MYTLYFPIRYIYMKGGALKIEAILDLYQIDRNYFKASKFGAIIGR